MKFKDLLRSIGFENRIGNISWLNNENDRIKSIFDWFNISITKENSIPINFNPEEIIFYKNLEKKGLVIEENFVFYYYLLGN